MLSPIEKGTYGLTGTHKQMAKTQDGWNKLKKKDSRIKKQRTLKDNMLFKDKKTNADAHRNLNSKNGNLQRDTLNAAGVRQMDASSIASNSRGFRNGKYIKDKKRTHSAVPDLASGIAALKADYEAQPKRKLPRQKFSKSPAVFKIDSASPYAEYLPDLYREYKPKEKKLKVKSSNVSMSNFLRKMDKAYSEAMSVVSESSHGSRPNRSRMRYGRSNSNTRSLKKMGTLRSNISSSSGGDNTVRSNPAKLRKKKKPQSRKSDDSFMKMANMVKARVSKEKLDLVI